MKGLPFGSPLSQTGLVHKRNLLIIYKIFTCCKGSDFSRFHITDAAIVTLHWGGALVDLIYCQIQDHWGHF